MDCIETEVTYYHFSLLEPSTRSVSANIIAEARLHGWDKSTHHRLQRGATGDDQANGYSIWFVEKKTGESDASENEAQGKGNKKSDGKGDGKGDRKDDDKGDGQGGSSNGSTTSTKKDYSNRGIARGRNKIRGGQNQLPSNF